MADLTQVELPNGSTYDLKDALGRKEAYLEWGGKNFTGSYGCLDAAMVSNLNANRFSFLKPAGVTIEYTRDGGTTWTDYGASDEVKSGIFDPGNSLIIGKADSTNKATANGTKYQLRITINTATASIYTGLQKIVIFCSTNGSADCRCQISGTLKPSTSYTNITDPIPIGGWSGYNVIQVGITIGNSFDGQYNNIRFLFTANGGNTTYAGLTILQIMGFGGMGWTTPSTMAKNGHLYSYDGLQNATFPANVTATKFIGPLQGNADTATSATTATKLGSANVGSARQPIYLNAGSPTAGNYTVAHYGNAGKSNMNDVGRLHASAGMTNLTDPSNNYDNPMNGTTKSTSWHLYWDASYTEDPNGSNSWVSQICNKAGTAQWWVRSRAGGKITDGTAWAAGWEHLVVAPQAGQGDSTTPIYIDANGHTQSLPYTIAKSVPSNAAFTDANVTQTISNTENANYRLLMSGTADDTTRTEGARKSAYLNFNPSAKLLTLGSIQYAGVNISIKTGSTAQSHITLETLMTWLITTQKLIPSGVSCHLWITTSWAYASNDILQFAAHGTNYECQLAGCFIEFIGYATNYNTGVFRLIIHNAPTDAFTPASGYTKMPVSSIAEYWCNGSTYSPVWKLYSYGGKTVLKDVPSNAVFTDTTYSAGSGLTLTNTTFNVGKRWKAVTQGQKWSRIYFAEPVTAVVGTSGFLSVACTRGNVVSNATFFITTSHNGASYSVCQELASCNYTQVRVRLVVAGGSQYYFEIYDTAASIASGTTQEWQCCFIPMTDTTLTCYTTFNDGTTVPSGYTATNDFTTTGGNTSSAIKNITRSGTTFTATRTDGTTFTFTQQDNNTTYTLGTSGNNVTLTPAGGTAQSITVPYATSAGSATDSTKVAKAGDLMTGTLRIESVNGSYGEGIRINKGNGGYSTLLFNANAGSTSGTQDGAWWVGANNATYSRRLMIAHNGSGATTTYFYADSASQVSPHLRVGNNILCDGVIAVTQTAGTSGGISLYSNASYATTYGIAFRTTANQGKHGYVQGDWATYLTMDGADNRGWAFKNVASGKGIMASISSLGHAVFNGSVTIGGNTTNTSGARMEYNSTTQAIDFVFN